MRTARFVLPLAMALMLAQTVHAQTTTPSDCATPLNRVSCLREALSTADSLIGVTYRTVMRRLSPEEQAALRDEERAWIREKEAGARQLPADSVRLLTYLLEQTNSRIAVLERFGELRNEQADPLPAASDEAACWPEELTRRYFVWRDEATDVRFARERFSKCTYRVEYAFRDDPAKGPTDRAFVAVLRTGDRARYVTVLRPGTGWTPWGLDVPARCEDACDLPLSEEAAYALPLQPDEQYVSLRPEAAATSSPDLAEGAVAPSTATESSPVPSEAGESERSTSLSEMATRGRSVAVVIGLLLAAVGLGVLYHRRPSRVVSESTIPSPRASAGPRSAFDSADFLTVGAMIAACFPWLTTHGSVGSASRNGIHFPVGMIVLSLCATALVTRKRPEMSPFRPWLLLGVALSPLYKVAQSIRLADVLDMAGYSVSFNVGLFMTIAFGAAALVIVAPPTGSKVRRQLTMAAGALSVALVVFSQVRPDVSGLSGNEARATSGRVPSGYERLPQGTQRELELQEMRNRGQISEDQFYRESVRLRAQPARDMMNDVCVNDNSSICQAQRYREQNGLNL